VVQKKINNRRKKNIHLVERSESERDKKKFEVREILK
jgi:hypothetical protein